jgi:predicted nucleotide-binding protein
LESQDHKREVFSLTHQGYEAGDTLRARVDGEGEKMGLMDRDLFKRSSTPAGGKNIFIGHGGSLVWLELKAFLTDRLHLCCDEFNAVAVAGTSTVARLERMLENAQFAFLVMTAEDTHADSTAHARENVIHEAGLFQGRLGFEKAIILLENGCEEFSNIKGLAQIRFPKGNLKPVFEEIRSVLEREGVI